MKMKLIRKKKINQYNTTKTKELKELISLIFFYFADFCMQELIFLTRTTPDETSDNKYNNMMNTSMIVMLLHQVPVYICWTIERGLHKVISKGK